MLMNFYINIITFIILIKKPLKLKLSALFKQNSL